MAEQIKQSAYLFSIAFLLLGILFILLALYSIPCIIKSFKSNQFFPKVFYIFTLIICVDQATYQLLYLYQVITAINKSSDNKNDESDSVESFRYIFFQTIYIPDAIFFIIYFSLFWQFIIMMYQGRIQTGNILIGKKNWNPQSANPKIRIILYLYIVGQGITIWQFFVRETSPKIIMIFDIVVNASVPFIVLVMILYMNVKFSGSPFVSNRYERRNHKIQQLLWIWIILRIPQLAVNVIIVVYNEDMIKLFQGRLDVSLIEQLFLIFFLVGDVIVVQIVPLLIAMSNDFLKALLTDHNKIQLLGSVETFQEDQVLQSIEVRKETKIKELNQFTSLKLSDIKFDERQFFKKFNGFGEIKIATLLRSQQKYAMRIISFRELSSFLIDETKQEIEFINSRSKSYRILWFQIVDSNMYLLMKFYQNQSLHHFIHSEQQKINEYPKEVTKSISNKQIIIKINIAIDILKALNNLHNQNVVHGHLNCNNVMFTKKYNIKIVDFGLRAIKKYSSLVNGYCNKNGFTAPECLGDKGSVVSQSATKESDIYSYGMILYNLFAETIPFYNMPAKEMVQLVKEQQNRPKIPDSVQLNIATLIRCCWQQEPSKRPSYQQILSTLNQLSANLD